jgi:hypothetical protein
MSTELLVVDHQSVTKAASGGELKRGQLHGTAAPPPLVTHRGPQRFGGRRRDFSRLGAILPNANGRVSPAQDAPIAQTSYGGRFHHLAPTHYSPLTTD